MKKHLEQLKNLPNNGRSDTVDFVGNYPQEILDLTIQQRLELWYAKGEKGLSSKTIAKNLSTTPFLDSFNKRAEIFENYPPSDVSDFRRCYLLLKLIPEWKERMSELACLKGWEKLVENWDKITELYEKGVVKYFELLEKGKRPYNKFLKDCYALMKEKE